MLSNVKIQNTIAQVLFKLYKCFSVEYKILNGLKNKNQKQVIFYLKWNKRFILHKDKQQWNIIDNAHLFQCYQVIEYIQKHYKIDYSVEYKNFLIQKAFNGFLIAKYTTNALKIIHKSFIKTNKINNLRVDYIEKLVCSFIAKNGY